MNYKNLKVETLNNNNFFVKWDNWLKKNQISALQACLAFVKEIKEIDKIIIGIDNFEQLKEISTTYKLIKKTSVPNFAINRDLKDPSKWAS